LRERLEDEVSFQNQLFSGFTKKYSIFTVKSMYVQRRAG